MCLLSSSQDLDHLNDSYSTLLSSSQDFGYLNYGYSTHRELKARDADARGCCCASQADEVARTGDIVFDGDDGDGGGDDCENNGGDRHGDIDDTTHQTTDPPNI